MIVNGETAFLLLRAKSYMASVEMELERSKRDIYMAKIYEIFIDSAYEIISKKLPQKELGERTREEMVKDHLSLL